MCDVQTQNKYTSRPSPPYPANECCGEQKRGNDGRMYVSVRNARGICAWKLHEGSESPARRPRAASPAASRKRETRAESPKRESAMLLGDLKALARTLSAKNEENFKRLRGYSTMKKAELHALLAHMGAFLDGGAGRWGYAQRY